ncbi:MAG: hypothetical protein V1904_10885, partial [Bacteroidota bacterium]
RIIKNVNNNDENFVFMTLMFLCIAKLNKKDYCSKCAVIQSNSLPKKECHIPVSSHISYNRNSLK